MKAQLHSILNNDSSANKSATRYLYKTHPELWENILETTSFLPDDALAKQRVWHVLNEIYLRPTCPVTGEFVRWREKDYDKYSSKEAKDKDIGRIVSAAIKGDKHWRNDTEKSRQANEKFAKGFSEGKHKPMSDRKHDYKQINAKAKQTLLRKYGVSNPVQMLEVRKKISNRNIERGCTPKHLRSLRKIYYDAVWYYTEQSWRKEFNKINPERLNRSNNALDHIYSIQQGFRENIPAYIIGHWTNLRVISLSENSVKGMKCGKTQDQLFEDFDKARDEDQGN